MNSPITAHANVLGNRQHVGRGSLAVSAAAYAAQAFDEPHGSSPRQNIHENIKRLNQVGKHSVFSHVCRCRGYRCAPSDAGDKSDSPDWREIRSPP